MRSRGAVALSVEARCYRSSGGGRQMQAVENGRIEKKPGTRFGLPSYEAHRLRGGVEQPINFDQIAWVPTRFGAVPYRESTRESVVLRSHSAITGT
jgi:hypothetical protein